MLMSPTQSGISAHQSLANPMGLPAGRFLPLPPIGASIYKYRSISESDRIPAQGWNEETEKILDKGTEARRAARNSGIAPAVTRVIPDMRKRPPKHKKQLLDANLE